MIISRLILGDNGSLYNLSMCLFALVLYTFDYVLCCIYLFLLQFFLFYIAADVKHLVEKIQN